MRAPRIQRSVARRSSLIVAVILTLSAVVGPSPGAVAAPVFTDGFESGTTSAWTAATRFTVQGQTVRTGSWAGRAASTGQSSFVNRTFAPLPEVWAKVAFRVASRSSPVWLMALNKVGGGVIVRIGLNNAGALIVRNVPQARTTTSTLKPSIGAWHDLLVRVRTGSAGRFEVSVDGTIAPNLAQDAGLGTAALNKLVIGDTAANRTYVVDYDDASISPDPPGPPDPGDDPAVVGRWAPLFDLGIPAVHAIVLRTGKVLAFYRTNGTIGTVARLWDPATGAIDNVDATGGSSYNYFCSGHSVLPDGRIFITGGTTTANFYGERRTAFFDPISETWSLGPSMANERWYPSNVTLPDGDVLVLSGSSDPDTFIQQVERYDLTQDRFSTLPPSADSGASNFLYPRLFVLPDGTIARVGMDRQTRFLDLDTNTWTAGPDLTHGNRANSSMVALPGNRVLAIGGSTGGQLPTRTTEMIDFDDASPRWRSSGSMAEARQHLNAVLLPDGKVLAVGGTRDSSFYDDPVYPAELFDPASETWTTMDSAGAPRAYHSTAVLLPDGRVFAGGHTRGTLDTTAEIYSPPYLFAGPRPVIDAAPSTIGFGGQFTVSTDEAAAIDGITLIRAGSVTHTVAFDQRSVPLSFTKNPGSLRVQAPGSALDAPPGWYMLFLLDGGVPSVATWVQIG